MWDIKMVACELFKDKVEKDRTCQTWYTGNIITEFLLNWEKELCG